MGFLLSDGITGHLSGEAVLFKLLSKLDDGRKIDLTDCDKKICIGQQAIRGYILVLDVGIAISNKGSCS